MGATQVDPAGRQGDRMLSKELLDILVCPACKGDLEYDQANQKLICHLCRLRYAIEEDIPIMLVDEAEKLDQAGPASP
jgi:hypothetical protein